MSDNPYTLEAFDKRDEARREQWQKLRKADARRYIAAQLLAAEVGTRGHHRVSANDVAGVVKLADALLLELAK